MSESPFIHLAVRSSYSLLESMISPKDLKSWCLDHAMPAVAITDRTNLVWALETSLTLSGAGIQPIMARCFDAVEKPPAGKTRPAPKNLPPRTKTGLSPLWKFPGPPRGLIL